MEDFGFFGDESLYGGEDFNEYNSFERDDDYNVWEENQIDLDREWEDDTWAMDDVDLGD